MTVDQAIEYAISLVERGDLPSAEHVYSQILEAQPHNKIVKHLIKEVQGASHALKFGTAGQKSLLHAFRTSHTHYNSVPDYNLNWAIGGAEGFDEFFRKNQINVVDVGARDGRLGEIEELKRFINFLGFDADKDECDRLNSHPPMGFKSFKIFPFFIGTNNEWLDFHIYRSPGDSSIYKPADLFAARYNNNFSIEKTVKVHSVSLEQALAEAHFGSVDFIKLDTQGSELQIIQSSAKLFGDTLLIESEVEFTEMYKGQPLAGEFLSYMDKLGFDLLYLNRVMATSQNYQGPSRGQLVFSDMLFSKRVELLDDFPDDQIAKHLILLVNYGHLDRAAEIFKRLKRLEEIVPFITQFFRPFSEVTERIELMSRDKTLCWQLHQRKTNGLQYDSDRSWPVR